MYAVLLASITLNSWIRKPKLSHFVDIFSNSVFKPRISTVPADFWGPVGHTRTVQYFCLVGSSESLKRKVDVRNSPAD